MDDANNNCTDDEIEEFSDEFKCCVCLELIYKPVVLACGHISCFWCVFGAMDTWQVSRCPVCRHSYNHFPTICQLLHFLLLKLYPKAYKMRERQVTEDEKNIGTFSPQFEDYLSESHNLSPKSSNKPLDNLQLQPNCVREDELHVVKDATEMILSDKDHETTLDTNLNGEATTNVAVAENSTVGNSYVDGSCKRLLITDLLCVRCKRLLYRPLVLNCGHVFCEACIINSSSSICRCPLCQSLHPNGFPKVCLVLEHLLEDHVSKEYAERRVAVQNFGNCVDETSSTCSTKVQQSGVKLLSHPISDYLSGRGPKVHFGVGCDYCGMYPIIGERFKCKDCVEEIGFDLCEECYCSSSKLPGRFNQRHTPEHKFEVVQPMMLVVDEFSEEHSPENSDDHINVSAILDYPPPADSEQVTGEAAALFFSNDSSEHQEHQGHDDPTS